MSAESAAFAPGSTVYGSPASRSMRQTTRPGSEITGMPASETMQTCFPSLDMVMIFSAASRSLNLWQAQSGFLIS